MNVQNFARTLLALLLASGFTAACDPGPAPLPFAPAGPEAAPDPAAPGPYAVGVKTIWLVDPSRDDPYGEAPGRRFRVEIWYPAMQEARDGVRDRVDLFSEAPASVQGALAGVTVPVIEQPALRDATLDVRDAPYPVIVFSHGNGGIRAQSFTYTAHLASHGYVVVSPDHVGNTLFDLLDVTDIQGDTVKSIFDRPEDLRLILDALADGSFDDAGEISAAADLSRVGMTGHSLGGLTALFVTHPEGEAYDDRYKVVVPITPASSILSMLAAPVETMPLPVLYLGATDDQTLDYAGETLAAYDLAPGDRAVAGVRGAGHFSFTEICNFDLAAAALALGMDAGVASLLDDGCGEANIPVPRAHTLAGWYGAAWFNTYLRDSEITATTWLDPARAPSDVEFRLDRPGQTAP